MSDNYNKVSEIAAKHLGQVGGAGYSDQYDPSLLVRIPRSLNREAYRIQEDSLPFVGYDVWNAYEVSALTSKGLPVSGMLKIVCPANTQYHVESKSIKLYLNSFNMTVVGDTAEEVKRKITERVSDDLSILLEAMVGVYFFDEKIPGESFKYFVDIKNLVDLDSIDFSSYKSDSSLLKVEDSKTPFYGNIKNVRFSTDLLRSNCRVTNQPDWGNLYIHYIGDKAIDFKSVAQYVVSHRKVNHFHEEIVEMVYTHFMEVYQPKDLMVAALYTRRGGIDINPIRATTIELIPDWFTADNIRIEKTLRQ